MRAGKKSRSVRCCRFRGHQDKVFSEPESVSATTEVQPRVQAHALRGHAGPLGLRADKVVLPAAGLRVDQGSARPVLLQAGRARARPIGCASRHRHCRQNGRNGDTSLQLRILTICRDTCCWARLPSARRSKYPIQCQDKLGRRPSTDSNARRQICSTWSKNPACGFKRGGCRPTAISDWPETIKPSRRAANSGDPTTGSTGQTQRTR